MVYKRGYEEYVDNALKLFARFFRVLSPCSVTLGSRWISQFCLKFSRQSNIKRP